MIRAVLENLLAPTFLRENAELALFLALLTYVLLAVNWVVTTDWEAKFHWGSLIICAVGLFYLHYSYVVMLLEYENLFVTVWLLLLSYHWSTWRNNYEQVRQELDKPNPPASLRSFQGSIFRIFIRTNFESFFGKILIDLKFISLEISFFVDHKM